MMIHESPFTGWIDHGFYSPQPTLYFDVAEFNNYVVVGMFVEDLTAQSLLQIKSRDDVVELVKSGKLPENSMLMVLFKKSVDGVSFQIPIQGYYRSSLSAAGMSAWHGLR